MLLAENLRLMLGAEDLIDFRTILSRGQPLLVFLGKGPVSEELVDILGSLLLQLLFQAAYARGRHERSPYLLCLDEFFHLLQAPGLARRFQTALTTTRSFGLFLCLVCHNFAQLPTSLHDIALGNCDAVAMFRTNSNNAEQLGDFLPEVALELAAKVWKQKRRLPSRSEIRRYQIEQLQRLPSREMLLYNRRKPHRAVRIRVPDLPLPHQLARTSEAELERRLHDEGWDRGSLAVPKATLKAQIEARRRRLYDLLHPPVELTHMTKNDPSQTQRPTPKRPKLG